MTRVFTFFVLLSLLFLPGGYAHSDQDGIDSCAYSSLDRLPASVFLSLPAESSQVSKTAGHGASKADHSAKAIEVEEDEEPVSLKYSAATVFPGIGLYLLTGNPFIKNLVHQGRPFCEHFSYSSPTFILLRVIRI